MYKEEGESVPKAVSTAATSLVMRCGLLGFRSRSSMMAAMTIKLVHEAHEHVDELHLVVLYSAVAIEKV